VFKLGGKCVLSALMLAVLLAMVPLVVTASFASSNSSGVKKATSTQNLSVAAIAGKSKTKTTGLAPGKVALKNTNLMVLGDSLSDGVWAGLYNSFRKNKNIKVLRKTKPSTGFVRVDFYDWNARLGQILTKTTIDVAVVMMGANDRQTIVTKSGRYRPGSERWREIYASRVDEFIRQLKTQGARIYWVGLPITRQKKFSRHMRILNEIFAERARVNNIVFVDIWNDFTNAKGNYSANGKDIKGRMRKLRANDGVHFTMRGYQKLALAAERFIRADFNKKTRQIAVVKPVKTKLNQMAVVALEPGMMAAAVVSDEVIEPKALSERDAKPLNSKTKVAQPEFIPAPGYSTTGSEVEKVKSLQVTLDKIARRIEPQSVNVRQQAQIIAIQPKIFPGFDPDGDYLAKNIKKSEKTDPGKAIQQALDNVFQDILSIVQPDKAVVATSRVAIAPDQEAHLVKFKALPQRQQKSKTVTSGFGSGLLRQSVKTDVAPRVAGIVGPVSIKSGAPDDNVEYGSKTIDGREALAGTEIASITPLPELDIKTASDGQGVLDTTGYRALLRGNAVSPKVGRGDDFSWPRD